MDEGMDGLVMVVEGCCWGGLFERLKERMNVNGAFYMMVQPKPGAPGGEPLVSKDWGKGLKECLVGRKGR